MLMVANHVNWMNVLRILHLLPLFLSLLTCSDEAPHDSIPFAPVNFQIDLKVLDHSLQNPLTYKISPNRIGDMRKIVLVSAG